MKTLVKENEDLKTKLEAVLSKARDLAISEKITKEFLKDSHCSKKKLDREFILKDKLVGISNLYFRQMKE